MVRATPLLLGRLRSLQGARCQSLLSSWGNHPNPVLASLVTSTPAGWAATTLVAPEQSAVFRDALRDISPIMFHGTDDGAKVEALEDIFFGRGFLTKSELAAPTASSPAQGAVYFTPDFATALPFTAYGRQGAAQFSMFTVHVPLGSLFNPMTCSAAEDVVLQNTCRGDGATFVHMYGHGLYDSFLDVLDGVPIYGVAQPRQRRRLQALAMITWSKR